VSPHSPRSVEQVLADRQRVLGEDHPRTLLCRNNLAGAYLAAGKSAQAIVLCEQNLACQGPKSPIVTELPPDMLEEPPFGVGSPAMGKRALGEPMD
jgi:hypothetical protein